MSRKTQAKYDPLGQWPAAIMTTVICHDVYGNEHETEATLLEWRPAAYVVMIEDGSVCLLKGSDGRYDLPGGAIELGEDPKAAAIREVKEETGLDISEPTLLGVESSLFRASHSDDRCYHSLLMYYHCTSSTGSISAVGFDEYEKQHVELAEWMPLEDLHEVKVGSTVDFRSYARKKHRLNAERLHVDNDMAAARSDELRNVYKSAKDMLGVHIAHARPGRLLCDERRHELTGTG
ncbi:hypothetical protein LTR56_016046 [Elasticomyces elasticus]|nr:hypothetical protein LTR56_016046 [Elasticomyces elasticus]KAK3642492.1 hypothetical protein LTR22_016126 [Elasticomyces elasticus]KAK4926975.1 hypothetical protein LTR49_006132 [Elasticomyces elasticus]KAK5764303.1 hypothetical protein LTS12_005516 [Elasticomyces elasticus]